MQAKSLMTLSGMLDRLTSLAAIQETVELYQQPLAAEHQFDLRMLVPLLEIRLKDIVSAHHALKGQLRIRREQMGKVLQQAEQVLASMASMFAIMNSVDTSSKICINARDLMRDFRKTCLDARSIGSAMVDQEIQAISLNVTLFAETHRIANDILQEGLYEEELIYKQLAIIAAQLESYRSSVAGPEIRKNTATVLKMLLDLKPKADLLANQVTKTSQPLLPTVLTDMARQLTEKYMRLTGSFDGLLNSIYASDGQQNALVEAAAIYQHIFGKIEGATAGVATEHVDSADETKSQFPNIPHTGTA